MATVPFKKSKGSSLFNKYDDEPATGGAPQFKFENVGDVIWARFLGRRFGVQTSSVENPATVLDVDIICSIVDGKKGPIGKHGVFESVMITSNMNEAKLNSGEPFVLRYCSSKKAKKGGRRKEFFFKKLPEQEILELEKELDDIPQA